MAETRDDLRMVDERALWGELVRRGAALRVGFCYPAMAANDEATALIQEHGYEFGPFQFLELGHRLAEPPQWPMFAAVPPRFRNPVGGEKWCTGAKSPRKVIHRRSCSSARVDYGWARKFPTATALAAAIVEGGATERHHACRRCCGDLDAAIEAAVADQASRSSV